MGGEKEGENCGGGGGGGGEEEGTRSQQGRREGRPNKELGIPREAWLGGMDERRRRHTSSTLCTVSQSSLSLSLPTTTVQYYHYKACMSVSRQTMLCMLNSGGGAVVNICLSLLFSLSMLL